MSGPVVDLEEEYPSGMELVLHPMRPLLLAPDLREELDDLKSVKRYDRKIFKLGFHEAAKEVFGKNVFTEPWPEQEESSTQPVAQSESTVRTAIFVQRLRIDEWEPAQLMLASISDGVGPSSITTRYIVMIFDPAVFRYKHANVGVNPVKQMQAYFSQNVHARISLDSVSSLPKFHGSFWAMCSSRRVGVILLEDVGIGRNTLFLDQLQPRGGIIDNDRRKKIIANILKADFDAWSGGVQYGMWTSSNHLLRLADDKIFLVDLSCSRLTTPKVPTGQEMLERWNHISWYYDLMCEHWIPMSPESPPPSSLPDQDFLMDCLKLGLGATGLNRVIHGGNEVRAKKKAKRPAADANPSGNNRYNLRSRK